MSMLLCSPHNPTSSNADTRNQTQEVEKGPSWNRYCVHMVMCHHSANLSGMYTILSTRKVTSSPHTSREKTLGRPSFSHLLIFSQYEAVTGRSIVVRVTIGNGLHMAQHGISVTWRTLSCRSRHLMSSICALQLKQCSPLPERSPDICETIILSRPSSHDSPKARPHASTG